MSTQGAEVQGGRGARPAWLWVGILAVTGSSGVVLAIVARTLTPAAFAGCATVLTASVVLSVVPGALQLRAAADAADGRPGPPLPRRLFVVIGALVVVTGPFLRLPPAAVGALALLTVALSSVARRRGDLLGRSDFRAVGQNLCVEAAGRALLGSGLGAVAGATGVAVALLAAAATAAAVAGRQGRRHGVRTEADGPGLDGVGLADTALALGLLALVAHLDVLLAPAALGRAAGSYDLAALPAKVIIVSLAAAGLVVFPGARRAAGRSAVIKPVVAMLAAGTVLAMGLVVGQPVLAWVFGHRHPDPVLLALLGAAMAVAAATSVGVHITIARGGRRPWPGLLVAAATEVATAAAHPRQVQFAIAVLVAQAITLITVVARLLAPQPEVRPRAVNVLRHRSQRRVPEISVVVPAWNEATRLPATLAALTDVLDHRTSEVIVVDDGSTDGTANVASVLLSPLPHALVMRMPNNRGKGAAVRAGVARARGRSIVFMDADLATALDDLPALIAALDDAHVAIGSRAAHGAEVTGASPTRIGMGRAFNHMVRAVTPLSLADTQCGFKAFRASTAKLLFHLARLDGYAFDVEVLTLAHRIGYPVAEVAVRWTAVEGSHVRPVADSLTMAGDLLRTSWRWQPHRVVAAIEAMGRAGLGVDRAVDLVRREVGVAGPVVAWGDRAIGLLPFTAADHAERMAWRMQHRLPDLRVEARPVRVGALLSASGLTLRAALAGA